jgi:hypothetical protein
LAVLFFVDFVVDFVVPVAADFAELFEVERLAVDLAALFEVERDAEALFGAAARADGSASRGFFGSGAGRPLHGGISPSFSGSGFCA